VAKQKKQSSVFWVPSKVGETLSGKIMGFQNTTGKFPGVAVNVAGKLVTLTTGLRRALLPLAGKIKVGKDTLSIEYLGKDGDKKTSFVKHEIKYNGKVLDTSSFVNETDAEKIEAMLREDEANKSKKRK